MVSSLLIGPENIYHFLFSVDNSPNYSGIANLKTFLVNEE